jgi:hypothetical protein
MNLKAILFLASSAILAASGCAGSVGVPTSQKATSATTPIKSRAQLQAYLVATTETGSPLNALPTEARSRFLASLSFNQKGITGYNYGDLHSDLTVRQVYQILSLFGAQRDTALVGGRVTTTSDRMLLSSQGIPNTDHPGYECVSHGSCYATPQFICMSDC